MPKNKVAYNDCYGIFLPSTKAFNWLLEHNPLFNDYNFLNRHDPLLIKCIETLGSDINSTVSDIKIAEIEGRVYRIEEYDGKEKVIEPDDLDWIVINKK